jgi:hypothetical protein
MGGGSESVKPTVHGNLLPFQSLPPKREGLEREEGKMNNEDVKLPRKPDGKELDGQVQR